MRKMKKIIILLLVIIMALSLSGCYDRMELDDLAYISVLGIDEGKEDSIILTLQIVIPIAIGSEGAGESKEPQDTKIISVEAKTIYTGLELVNNFLSKKTSLAQTELIVINKEVAKKGISKFISELFIGDQLLPNTYFAVCDNKASEFINSIKPVLETNPTKYISSTVGEKSSNMLIGSTFLDVYTLMQADYGDACLTFAGTSKEDMKEEDLKKNSEEGDYIAGNIPKVGGPSSEFMGLAVFDNMNFTEVITGRDVWMYKSLMNELNNKFISLKDPDKKDYKIEINIKQYRTPKVTVDTGSDKPKINIELYYDANIVSIQSDMLKDVNIDEIRRILTDNINKSFSEFLEKISHEYKSDICEFGAIAKRNFLTLPEWNSYKWKDKYPNSEFNINSHFTIKRLDMYKNKDSDE